MTFLSYVNPFGKPLSLRVVLKTDNSQNRHKWLITGQLLIEQKIHIVGSRGRSHNLTFVVQGKFIRTKI